MRVLSACIGYRSIFIEVSGEHCPVGGPCPVLVVCLDACVWHRIAEHDQFSLVDPPALAGVPVLESGVTSHPPSARERERARVARAKGGRMRPTMLLLRARPLALHPLLRSSPPPSLAFSTTNKLSPEEMDRAIAEMNEEMSSLFGSPSGDVSSPPGGDVLGRRGISGGELHMQANPHRPTEDAAPLVAGQSTDFASARAALLGRIASCAAELGNKGDNTVDVERATRLATCIGECARAVAALDEVRG